MNEGLQGESGYAHCLLPCESTQDCAPGLTGCPQTGLNQRWTGYGGVGDYAGANGNTHAVVNAVHTLRNGDFTDRLRLAPDSGETYDLVVIGAGFSGCTAAYTYLKQKPDASILILDNHDMFGGEARQ